MALGDYTKQVWVDEVLAGAATYNVSGTGSGQTITLDQTVSVAGTDFTASRMNNIEDKVEELDTNIGYVNYPTYEVTDGNGDASVTISGLDIVADGGTYIIEIISSAAASIYMYLDGDTTATNYYSQGLQASGSSATAFSSNDATVGSIGYNVWQCTLSLKSNVITADIVSQGGTTGRINFYGYRCTNTVSNLNSITFSKVSGNFSADFTVKIYKRG